MRLGPVALVAVVVLGCREQEAPKPPVAAQRQAAAKPVDARIEELPSPAGTGAAEPFLSTTPDGVLLSWLEPVAGSDRVALRFSRHAAGKWSAPRTIVERNDLFVNWADFPSVVADAKGALYAHWLQKNGAGTYAYDVRMATSTDVGATWSTPFLLNRDGKQAEHGFVSLAALPGGGVGATWLDGRNMQAGTGDDHESVGEMSVRYAAVDAKGTITGDAELDARVCECCTTAMAVTTGGPVILYRDRSVDEIRDISYVRRSAGGWSEPRPVHADGWKINGCPVNGPQIDAIGNRAAAAWFTAANNGTRVYAAFSDDGGATFTRPVIVDNGQPLGRVDVVMLDEQTALVSWLEKTFAGAEIRARRIPREGELPPSQKIADSATARANGFARMARSGTEVWFAWTEQAPAKRIRVARGRF